MKSFSYSLSGLLKPLPTGGRRGFLCFGVGWTADGDMEASQTRDCCAAKNAARRAARSGSLGFARDRLFGDDKAVASRMTNNEQQVPFGKLRAGSQPA
jgi:hypothetical protein